jgi:hypothetical protein
MVLCVLCVEKMAADASITSRSIRRKPLFVFEGGQVSDRAGLMSFEDLDFFIVEV